MTTIANTKSLNVATESGEITLTTDNQQLSEIVSGIAITDEQIGNVNDKYSYQLSFRHTDDTNHPSLSAADSAKVIQALTVIIDKIDLNTNWVDDVKIDNIMITISTSNR